MKIFVRNLCSVACLLLTVVSVRGQEKVAGAEVDTKTTNATKGKTAPISYTGYNNNSTHPIHESQIMYKRTIWRTLDLKEKQNRPFMAENNQLVKILFDGLKANKIKAYKNDSVMVELKYAEFENGVTEKNNTMTLDELALAKKAINDQYINKQITKEQRDEQIAQLDAAMANNLIPAYKFTQIEMKEDLIFDRKHSKMYYDIQCLTIVLPPQNANPNDSNSVATSISDVAEREVATFKYKDIVKYFRDLQRESSKDPNNKKGIWFNEQNNAAHMNLADAFELRLFSSIITMVSNPRAESLDMIYGNSRVKPTVAAQQMEYKLMEYEHNLWEF
jgi:gliding motility associated protien GldN